MEAPSIGLKASAQAAPRTRPRFSTTSPDFPRTLRVTAPSEEAHASS
jgi:hypothetical protein